MAQLFTLEDMKAFSDPWKDYIEGLPMLESIDPYDPEGSRTFRHRLAHARWRNHVAQTDPEAVPMAYRDIVRIGDGASIIISDRGHIYLNLEPRQFNKLSILPPGGAREGRESLLGAAIRETQEEWNLSALSREDFSEVIGPSIVHHDAGRLAHLPEDLTDRDALREAKIHIFYGICSDIRERINTSASHPDDHDLESATAVIAMTPEDFFLLLAQRLECPPGARAFFPVNRDGFFIPNITLTASMSLFSHSFRLPS